jgi:hypothetical protein
LGAEEIVRIILYSKLSTISILVETSQISIDLRNLIKFCKYQRFGINPKFAEEGKLLFTWNMGRKLNLLMKRRQCNPIKLKTPDI